MIGESGESGHDPGESGVTREPGLNGEIVRSGLLVALDTATRLAAVAVGDGRGSVLASRAWDAGFRHGQELLAVLDSVLREAALQLCDVEAFVVGTGPGTFTGLRVGLATAKGLAHTLDRPIVGVPSSAALAYSASLTASCAPAIGEIVVLQPAGPHDRYVARYAVTGPGAVLRAIVPPRLVPSGEPLGDTAAGGILVPVDLVPGPGVPAELVEAGLEAQRGLGPALLALGRAALDRGERDDVAALVPAYVTLPRGVATDREEIAWARDKR
jgi:tRNA threonylcarbamoyl adenosine modification protein YeaZ